MIGRIFYWPEIRRIFAQWAGVVLASVLAGVLLGMLEMGGANEKMALEISLPAGFILAAILWNLIGHRFAVTIVRYAVAGAATTVEFQGERGMPLPTAAFATAAALVVSVYCIQAGPVSQHHASPTVSCILPAA
jgi:membrane-associated phospholipid phosphatase